MWIEIPLTATRGAAELLRDHAMSEAERLHFLGVIEAEVGRLDRLTRRLLELARADMSAGPGGGPTRVTPVLEALAARYTERGLLIRLPTCETMVAMGSEPLELMLEGLLDNVVAHGGATVDLCACIEAGEVLIRVADHGAGVSPANAARIFEPFFTTARERGGTGLGLPIVQALAGGVGGTIRLVPSPVGATFELRLPYAGAKWPGAR